MCGGHVRRYRASWGAGVAAARGRADGARRSNLTSCSPLPLEAGRWDPPSSFVPFPRPPSLSLSFPLPSCSPRTVPAHPTRLVGYLNAVQPNAVPPTLPGCTFTPPRLRLSLYCPDSVSHSSSNNLLLFPSTSSLPHAHFCGPCLTRPFV